MKKALYYAIRTGGLYNPVVAITSEKRHRWYGREVRDDMPTNGVLSDLSGKFSNVEDALAMRESIAALADKYDKARKVVQAESTALYRLEKEAMGKLLKGEEPGAVPQPVVSYDGSAVQLNDNGWHLPSLNEGLRSARVCNDHAHPHDLMDGNNPTDDAWVAACRAVDWRNAELRFHGHEPVRLPLDAPRYPPDNYDFSKTGD